MSQPFLLSLAQEGDPEAIAALINQALCQKGITATASLENRCLQVTLTSEQVPAPQTWVYFMYDGLCRLGVTSIQSVRVEGRQRNAKTAAWSQTFELPSANATSGTTPSLISPLPHKSKPRRKKLKFKIPLLWLNGMVWALVAISGVAIKYQLEHLKTTPKQSAPPPVVVLTNTQTSKTPPTPAAKPVKKPTPIKRLKPRARMVLKKTISGKITPKSVVHSGVGLFFAQNMMYTHTITVYNRAHKLVKTIPDNVNLAKYGYAKLKGNYRGAPVEASFSHNGKYAWVSNYQMYGSGFNNPGSDRCSPAQNKDYSFLYRINTRTLHIEKVIQVGAVPKFVATSPDNKLVLVSNWCSWDLSVIDTQKNREIKRIKLGPYPRGIAVDAASQKAYVAVMGSYNIAQVDLKNYKVNWLKNIGRSPRHLNIDPAGKYLYASLNGEGRIAKLDLSKGKVITKAFTGSAPRSMILSEDGRLLYVVNYSDHTVSKVRASDLKVLQTVKVYTSPIGITYDPQTREVWVACYSGKIMVFQD